MKEEFWKELFDLFEEMPIVKENHTDLYKTIKLIVEVQTKHKELEELNKELTELNK